MNYIDLFLITHLADKFNLQIMAESGKYDCLVLFDDYEDHEANTEGKESTTSAEKSKITKIMTDVCHS